MRGENEMSFKLNIGNVGHLMMGCITIKKGFCRKKVWWMDGWMDGWVGGWMDGWKLKPG